MKLVIRPSFAMGDNDTIAEDDEELAIAVRHAIAISPSSECIIQENEDGVFHRPDWVHS